MLSPIPLQEFEPCSSAARPRRSFPPRSFSSPEFFDFEFEAIWNHEWFCVGRTTDVLNPGDYYTVTVGAEPLIVVRGEDGVVRVLSAVCQHRGMIVVEGRGKARRLRCPFHAWIYGLDGALRSAPDWDREDRSFDLASICLPSIRTETWSGFIFVTFDALARPLASRFSRLDEQLANYDLANLRGAEPLVVGNYEWNWKLHADECYHCAHLHAKTWHRMFPTPSDRLVCDSSLNDWDAGIIATEIMGREVDSSPTTSGKASFPPLPLLSVEERRRLVYLQIMPNLLMVLCPDKVKYVFWLPIGPVETLLGVSWIYPEQILARPDFDAIWRKEHDELLPVMDEDIFAWSTVQRGLRSRFAPKGPLAPTEEMVVQFDEWLVKRYRAADESVVSPQSGD